MDRAEQRRALALELAGEVARAAGGRVVVFGSLPPDGGDLDLLARQPERERISGALRGAGDASRGKSFARFARCTAYEVELVAAEEYLPTPARERLFEQAIELPGLAPLARPAPHHALLVLARLSEGARVLAPKRRARLELALAEDPEAWSRAAREAAGWSAEPALAHLRALAEGREPTPGTAVRVAGAVRARVRGGGVLVALSGIDGSGKSTQTELLRTTLEELGAPAELVWNDIHSPPALDVLGKPAKAVLRALGREHGEVAQYDTPPDPGREDGSGRGALEELWSNYVTGVCALDQRRRAAAAALRGRVMIFDRGRLDLAVRIELLYRSRHVARQRRMIELLAPRPDVAILLDIPPELSVARKSDIWSAEHLRRQAERYRELADRFGVRRLDGTRAREEIAAEIARATWLALPG